MRPERPITDIRTTSVELRAAMGEAERRYAATPASLRLLFLIGGLGPGGAERQAVHILEGLPALGISVRLACFSGYEEDLLRVARAGVPIEFLTPGGRAWPVRMLRTLDRIVVRERVQVVQAFLWTFDILAPALRLRRPGLRVVTSRRGIVDQVRPRDLRLLRLTNGLAQAVVGNADSVVQSMIRLESLAPAKAICIPNGLDLPESITEEERRCARSHFGLSPEAFVVSYPAHFRRGKGHDHLPAMCRALMAAVPAARLILAGEADLNDGYRAVADRLRASLEEIGLAERVVWAGVVRDMRRLHAASDVSLNLSDFEGMSNSIMECLAHGVPVVATRAGGADQLIRDGLDGCLVECGDGVGAALKLTELARDPALRLRMGEQARCHVGEEFSVARMVRRYADLYRQVVGVGTGRPRDSGPAGGGRRQRGLVVVAVSQFRGGVFRMSDRYASYSLLSAGEEEGTDFQVRYRLAASPVAIIAPHGGGIEAGTSEIAAAIAGRDHSFYSFEGIRGRGNAELHLASTRFDEPRGLQVVSRSLAVVAIHGRDREDAVISLGGLHAELIDLLAVALERAGYAIARHHEPSYAGIDPDNICNRGCCGRGVQMELPRGLRRQLFPALNASGRRVRTCALRRFKNTVRSGLREWTRSAAEHPPQGQGR